eukprot:2971051-Pyramimonas_sp.AAC.2
MRSRPESSLVHATASYDSYTWMHVERERVCVCNTEKSPVVGAAGERCGDTLRYARSVALSTADLPIRSVTRSNSQHDCQLRECSRQ